MGSLFLRIICIHIADLYYKISHFSDIFLNQCLLDGKISDMTEFLPSSKHKTHSSKLIISNE